MLIIVFSANLVMQKNMVDYCSKNNWVLKEKKRNLSKDILDWWGLCLKEGFNNLRTKFWSLKVRSFHESKHNIFNDANQIRNLSC